MTTCVMGLLRLVRRVIRDSSATGRLCFSGLASLIALAVMGTTGAAQAQTPYPNPQDDYYCRVMGFECVKPPPQALHLYDFAGQLKRVTLPDTTWIGYDYDAAHRQIAVYDHLGNRTDYSLDNAGNRTGENTKDPSGALKRQLTRSIDALGRVQQSTGRE